LETAYSILKYGVLQEFHIVKGDFHADRSCNPEEFTICGDIKTREGKWYDDAVCLTKEEVGVHVKVLGNKFCPACMDLLPKW